MEEYNNSADARQGHIDDQLALINLDPAFNNHQNYNLNDNITQSQSNKRQRIVDYSLTQGSIDLTYNQNNNNQPNIDIDDNNNNINNNIIPNAIRTELNNFIASKVKDYHKFRNIQRKKHIALLKMESYVNNNTLPKDLDFEFKSWNTYPKTMNSADEYKSKEELIILNAKKDILKARIEVLKEDFNTFQNTSDQFDVNVLKTEFDKHKANLQLHCSLNEINKYFSNIQNTYILQLEDAKTEIDEKFQRLDDKYQNRLNKQTSQPSNNDNNHMPTDDNNINNVSNASNKDNIDINEIDDNTPITKSLLTNLIQKEVTKAISGIIASEITNAFKSLNIKNNSKQSSVRKNDKAPTAQQDRRRPWSEVVKNGTTTGQQKKSSNVPRRSQNQSSNTQKPSNKSPKKQPSQPAKNNNKPPPKPPHQHRRVRIQSDNEEEEEEETEWIKVPYRNQNKKKPFKPFNSVKDRGKGNKGKTKR